MPLPIILGRGAAIAGVVGVTTGVSGAKKMKDANDTMNSVKHRHEENIKQFEQQNKITTEIMNNLGKNELEILKSFDEFTLLIEKIQNKPQFNKYEKDGVEIPKYDSKKLKEVSIGAGVLLGGIGGAH